MLATWTESESRKSRRVYASLSVPANKRLLYSMQPPWRTRTLRKRRSRRIGHIASALFQLFGRKLTATRATRATTGALSSKWTVRSTQRLPAMRRCVLTGEASTIDASSGSQPAKPNKVVSSSIDAETFAMQQEADPSSRSQPVSEPQSVSPSQLVVTSMTRVMPRAFCV
jgi:hypothetical protein